MGRWLQVNGAAIFGTEPIYPFVFNLTRMDGPAIQLRMTQHRAARVVNVLLYLDGTNTSCWRVPVQSLRLPFVVAGGVDSSWPTSTLSRVELMHAGAPDVVSGAKQLALGFTEGDHGLVVSFPNSVMHPSPDSCAGPTGVSPSVYLEYVATIRLQYNNDSI